MSKSRKPFILNSKIIIVSALDNCQSWVREMYLVPGPQMHRMDQAKYGGDLLAAIAAEGMQADPWNDIKLQFAGEFHPATPHAWTDRCSALGCHPVTED